MLITRYCNLIGTANIPAVHTKTCPNTPDVFFPLPSFRRAQYTCARKIRLARETIEFNGEFAITGSPRHPKRDVTDTGKIKFHCTLLGKGLLLHVSHEVC